MNVEVRIDPNCAEARAVITAPRMTAEVEEALRLLARGPERKLTGFRGGEAELLDPADILRVYAGGGKVYAATERGEFELRMRLYEAERWLEAGSVLRLSRRPVLAAALPDIAGALFARSWGGDVAHLTLPRGCRKALPGCIPPEALCFANGPFKRARPCGRRGIARTAP